MSLVLERNGCIPGVDQDSGHFPTCHAVRETVKTENGYAVIVVPDSEAVIVIFNIGGLSVCVQFRRIGTLEFYQLENI